MQPFIRACPGCDRPKQYGAFIDHCSMLRRTLLRAERIIPRDRPPLGVEVYRVSRFWDKPSFEEAHALYLRGCLRNTMVLVFPDSRQETMGEQLAFILPLE